MLCDNEYYKLYKLSGQKLCNPVVNVRLGERDIFGARRKQISRMSLNVDTDRASATGQINTHLSFERQQYETRAL